MSAGCSEKCWTPVPCPVHPQDTMQPFGRSAPLEAYSCCDTYQQSAVNPRHLWSEHDSTRWYTDPEGWNLHALNCDRDDCEPIPAPVTPSGDTPPETRPTTIMRGTYGPDGFFVPKSDWEPLTPVSSGDTTP